MMRGTWEPDRVRPAREQAEVARKVSVYHRWLAEQDRLAREVVADDGVLDLVRGPDGVWWPVQAVSTEA